MVTGVADSMCSKSVFSSNREKWLWVAGLATQVTIFSTLGLQRTWAIALTHRGVIDDAFFAGFVLFLIGLVGMGVGFRPNQGETFNSRLAQIGIACCLIAVYLLFALRITIPAERTHLIEYGVVGVLILEALNERKRQDKLTWSPLLIALCSTILLGILDECLQAFVPNRVFDPIDIAFNTLATIFSIGTVSLLRFLGKRFR